MTGTRSAAAPVVGLASLPMYDLPELRWATDAWWQGLALHLREAGLRNLPEALSRPEPGRGAGGEADPVPLLRDPRLVIGQTCGYPLTHGLAGWVSYLGTPRYAAPGCKGSDYRSFVVLRADDPAETPAALRGRRAVINGWDSQSGMNALRALVAPHAQAGRFFAQVVTSGAHRRSLAMIREGRADLAAIDCVTLELLRRVDPAALEGLEARFETPAAPALPYVTRHGVKPGLLAALRAGIKAALADPELAEVRAALLLTGMDFDRAADYSVITEMERTAELLGYLALA
ncbi:ABC-type phosphate/phosphonate transport system, substrate-binding protein [Tistlia consotensis]|uniref:ABC-type phosphate/phosphonate transport system, substrate-binding protein n=1 Tax=Tistlia consotensis USBA 355 TaxID=560819 RepID=A0A1Y6BLG7_9PROT|nr:PhnD/SsuA/transferrin family substrate-binding protein [Tistlia consotensis]SMF16545.1 ABC-type phosphate/phosphonate transport system, substrate-binding protein [Tistlia consotensis USBA 355]SNR41058.1 ABC-type phosphate/phosphonate transport system, substrate-binding protein [Tistlia consotensis]